MDFELYMQDLLRQLSAGLLLPVLIILAGLALYSLYCIGSIIAEVILQRRHFKENVPRFIASIEDCAPQDVQQIIKDSGMLARQKKVLLVVADNMKMSAADLYALAKREIGILAEQYEAVTSRTDMAAKVAPMFGLMGTLIPLGPGIVAMGQGNTEVLASSLLVAFDTTVAGLICAAVCLVVSRLRKHWYRKYMSAVEASMTAILDKAQSLRELQGDDLIAEAEAILEEQDHSLPIAAPVIEEDTEVVEEAVAEEPSEEVSAVRYMPKEPTEPEWFQTAKMNANKRFEEPLPFHAQPTEEFEPVSIKEEEPEEAFSVTEAVKELESYQEEAYVEALANDESDQPSLVEEEESVEAVDELIEEVLDEALEDEAFEEEPRPVVQNSGSIRLDDLLIVLEEGR